MGELQRIGILGGTFDPIHQAHLQLGRIARDTFSLSQIVVMPTGHSYLKEESRQVTSAYHRAAMVRLAIEGEQNFSFSEREMIRGGATYTADTLRELHQEFPQKEFFFILGADALLSIESWYHPEIIFQNASIIAATRNGQVENQEWERSIRHLKSQFHARIYPLPFRDLPFSSSELRKRIADNEDVSAFFKPKVLSYIQKNKLYLGNSQ